MINIAKPIIGDEEKQAVLAVLESGALAQGSQVTAFEKAFASYCGVKHAIATSSGTTAIHLALLANGIMPGDEIITSPFSFIATANAIRYTGASPVFADIAYDTFNLDPAAVESRITPQTKAIMPVHLFGHPADMAPLLDIAERHHLKIIEDACQAHGAEYRGSKTGTFGTGCFSFYPTKNITSGEGGMVTTSDEDVADSLRLLRNHGMRQRYHHEVIGYNFRMTDIHAAIGLAQLNKLEKFNLARIDNASFLTEQLVNSVTVPVTRPGTRHVFHQYTIRISSGRDIVHQRLHDAGIDTGIYYPVPIHHQKPYRELYKQESYPVAETACREVLSLPVHAALSRTDLETVVAGVRQCLRDLS